MARARVVVVVVVLVAFAAADIIDVLSAATRVSVTPMFE